MKAASFEIAIPEADLEELAITAALSYAAHVAAHLPPAGGRWDENPPR